MKWLSGNLWKWLGLVGFNLLTVDFGLNINLKPIHIEDEWAFNILANFERFLILFRWVRVKDSFWVDTEFINSIFHLASYIYEWNCTN